MSSATLWNEKGGPVSLGLAEGGGVLVEPYVAAGPDENGWDCDCGARRISFEHHPVICPVCKADVRAREQDPQKRAAELEERRRQVGDSYRHHGERVADCLR